MTSCPPSLAQCSGVYLREYTDYRTSMIADEGSLGGTLLMRTPPPVGPYSSPLPRDLW